MPNGKNDGKIGSESSNEPNDNDLFIKNDEETDGVNKISESPDVDDLEIEYQQTLKKEQEARDAKKEEGEDLLTDEETGGSQATEPDKPSRASERIRELVRKNKERDAEIERLKKEIEESASSKEKQEEEDYQEEPSVKVKDQIKQELIEETFLETIGIENHYDAQVMIKGLKPVALSLLKTGKAKTYKEALGKAYVFDNMEEEINRRVVGKSNIHPASGLHGGSGSLGISSQPQSYTKADVAGARRLGMTLKDYLSFKV